MDQGKITSANGVDKTTTLRAISNVIVRRKGMLRYAGIGDLAPEEFAKLGVAHVADGLGGNIREVWGSFRVDSWRRNQ